MRSVHVGIRFDCARLIAAAVRSLADCCPGQRGCIALGRALTDSTSLGLLDLSATLETAPIGVVHTHTHTRSRILHLWHMFLTAVAGALRYEAR